MVNQIKIAAGADFALTYDWDSTVITGYKFYVTIKRDLADADTAAAATADATAGAGVTSVTVTFTGAQTAALAGLYHVDCKVVDGSGNVSMIPPEGPDELIVSTPATLRSS